VVRVETAVLMPVKAFTAAKGRLSVVLDRFARAELARWLAGRVVAAAGGLPTFIACDDDEVAAWADGHGASVLWSPGLGLNGAVDAGRATIAGKGFDHVIIAHSDLPLATDLAVLAAPRTITLVPDRRRDGTNVVASPLDVDLPAAYGGGSFARHFAAALATGRRVEVRPDPRLSLDVDTPDDLAHPALRSHLPTWLRTSLDSRP
jgi:2-phospho-L-lactate/phosphoenolpyruvate guanylyltransferase